MRIRSEGIISSKIPGSGEITILDCIIKITFCFASLTVTVDITSLNIQLPFLWIILSVLCDEHREI